MPAATGRILSMSLAIFTACQGKYVDKKNGGEGEVSSCASPLQPPQQLAADVIWMLDIVEDVAHRRGAVET